MRNLILSMLFLVSSLVNAGVSGDTTVNPVDSSDKFHPGIVYLTSDGLRPDGFCGSHTMMVLDAGSLVGNFAYFEEQMAPSSTCEIMLSPNPRIVFISEIRDAGCGSVTYEGYLFDQHSIKITITDHRFRLCFDMLANLVSVDFEYLDLGKTMTFRSYF